jgi:hypothetical protein
MHADNLLGLCTLEIATPSESSQHLPPQARQSPRTSDLNCATEPQITIVQKEKGTAGTMVVKIRLARFGRTNKPFYNIVVAHAR